MLEDGLRDDFPTDLALVEDDQATILLALTDMLEHKQLTDELLVLRGGLPKEAAH